MTTWKDEWEFMWRDLDDNYHPRDSNRSFTWKSIILRMVSIFIMIFIASILAYGLSSLVKAIL